MSDKYFTDTIKFAKAWSKWLKDKESEGPAWLGSIYAEREFVKDMREIFDKDNPDYTKSANQAIRNKANYVNALMKKNGYERLFMPGYGKPRTHVNMSDKLAAAGFTKIKDD